MLQQARPDPKQRLPRRCVALLRLATWCPLILVAPALLADSFRVTTWDLAGFERPGTNGSSAIDPAHFQSAAVGLKALNPDVVWLRNVPDWESARALARALGSNTYNVVVCSAFRGEAGQATSQLAVIAKRKAYFSWSEQWDAGSGIVFAALQTGNQRVGFFLAQAGVNSDQPMLARRWMEAAAGFRAWTANRLDSALVGVSVATPRGAETVQDEWRTRQFTDLARSAFPENAVVKAGAGSLVTARLEANPVTVPALIASQWPATLDLAVEVGQASALLSVEGGAPISGASATLRQVLGPDPTRLPASYAWASPYVSMALKLITDEREKVTAAGGAAAALLIVFVMWRVRARRKRRLRLAAGAARMQLADQRGAAGLLGDGVGEALAPGASGQEAALWRERAIAAEAKARQALDLVRANAGPALGELLQSAAVQKLVTDRSSLLEAQGKALSDAHQLDDRMARIEEQLRQQSQSYEQRIRELEEDLAAAQQQNRALIQSKIHQLKAEMEAARVRALEESF